MKKRKLVWLSAIASISSFTIISCSCTNKKQDAQKNLEEYAKTFSINIDTTKYTIEEAKNINNYKFTLKNGYEFKLKKIEVTGNKVTISYSIFDKKNNLESKVINKEFSNFKAKNPIPDKFDSTKYAELINIFQLNTNKYASENVDLLSKDKSNIDFKLTEVSVLEYDDLWGFIKTKIKGTYKGIPFELNNFKIDSFKKVDLFDKLEKFNGKLNIEKMINENKKIEDLISLSQDDLLQYFSELFAYNQNNEKIDVINLLKNKKIKLDIFKILAKGTNYVFNIKISQSYKKFSNNKIEEINHKISEELNRPLDKIKYNNKDIVNFLVSKYTKKDEKHYSYASGYRGDFWKRKLHFLNNFLELKDENKYKDQFNILALELKEISVSANDITGTLYVSYQLKMHLKGGEEIESDIHNLNIKGFKKIDENFLKSNFLLSEKNPSDARWKKYAQELKTKYDSLTEEEKRNFKIDNELEKAKYFGYTLGNDNWNVLRQRNFKNQELNEIRDNGIWNFVYRNKGNTLSDAFNSQINTVDDNKNAFQLNNINIKYKTISNFRYDNGKFKFDYIFEIRYTINNGENSNSEFEKDITIEKAFTQYLNI